jgi:hypothetical protein
MDKPYKPNKPTGYFIWNHIQYDNMDQSRPEKPDPYSEMTILVLPPKASLLVSVSAATAPHPCGF